MLVEVKHSEGDIFDPEAPKSGCYKIANQEYHQAKGVSSSILREMLRSPLHCWTRHIDPDRPHEEPTANMLLGTAAHTATLEPEQWESTYAVAPKCDRRTKAGKEAWAEFQEIAEGRITLSQEQADTAQQIAKAVMNHKGARRLLADGEPELSLFIDDYKGELVKVRPDWWGDVIVDLKTTKDASPDAFVKQVANYQYHLQAALYSDIIEEFIGESLPFYWIAVESEPPHAVAVYSASPDMMEAGQELYRAALTLYSSCRQQNRWPGYDEAPQTLELPAWARKATLNDTLANLIF